MILPVSCSPNGEYREPTAELRFEQFISSLLAKAIAAGWASSKE